MPKRPHHKAIAELVDWARPLGWRFTGYAKSGHVILEHDNGKRYHVASTPSEYRTVANIKAELERQAGRKVSRPKAGKYRKGGRQAGYAAGYTPSYDAAPWRVAADELDDVDGQLSVLDPQRHPLKARKLAARRLELEATLRRYHKPVPPHPLASI